MLGKEDCKFLLKFNLSLKAKYIKWCKCNKSGLSGLFLDLNNLLIIEKKFSNAGYHSNKTIKIGEINWLSFENWIR